MKLIIPFVAQKNPPIVRKSGTLYFCKKSVFLSMDCLCCNLNRQDRGSLGQQQFTETTNTTAENTTALSSALVLFSLLGEDLDGMEWNKLNRDGWKEPPK